MKISQYQEWLLVDFLRLYPNLLCPFVFRITAPFDGGDPQDIPRIAVSKPTDNITDLLLEGFPRRFCQEIKKTHELVMAAC